VFAEVFDLGVVLQWDRGTRVYVRVDPKWKDRVSDTSFNMESFFFFLLIFIHAGN
jgi:hypothetical protein